MRFILLRLPLALLKLSFYFFVFATPLLGVWLTSSLVAYTNGPIWLAVSSGILLFPLIPMIWDLLARRNKNTKGFLTWGDRITLRALVLNFLFIACLLALRPQTAFLAISTRGDWMLDNRQGQNVELVRQSLFKLANGLEWLYLAVHENPYRQYADTTQIEPSPQTDTTQIEPSAQTDTTQKSSKSWPWKGQGIHSAVANMPVDVETSIKSVAQYIALQEKDPVLRIKALHDYVADRIAYDAPAYFAGQIPPQDAQTVFSRRTAVCAGYAKLLEALGKAIGEEIVYVAGDSRSETSDLGGRGHAWNGVKIAGKWYLIDATWDSGYVDSSGFTKNYKNDYLLPPPRVMAISHFPDDPAWQLLPQPLDRGEFLRQPMLRPQFFAQGLSLISPQRSQTDIQGDAIIKLENPQQRWLIASYQAKGVDNQQRCMDLSTDKNQISCTFPSSGTYEVRLFSGDSYLGQLEFNKR